MKKILHKNEIVKFTTLTSHNFLTSLSQIVVFRELLPAEPKNFKLAE
jgi:hypothetical protein